MVNDDHRPFLIRGYRRSDREAVRKLCCDTGFLGDPIDPVYEDRELFADFLTTYYTDHEPGSCFLLEVDGEIRGYLLGSRKPLQNQLYALYQNVWLFFRALTRYFRYNERSRRFVRWILVHGWREVPAAPRRTPHFHINLLPDARKVSTTRALMSAYLSYLYRSGEKRVYGQIITFESRRGEKMFERYGFKVLNRAEITKYKAIYPESVYLSTVIKNLETAEPLSVTTRSTLLTVATCSKRRRALSVPHFLAGIAQLVEQLICNQQVVGSNPSAGSLHFPFSNGDCLITRSVLDVELLHDAVESLHAIKLE